MKKNLFFSLAIIVILTGALPVQAAESLSSRLKGRILLQVESHGEAWYVDPVDLRRTYLKDGAAAFDLLRSKGLGITNENLAKIPIGLEDRFSLLDTDGDGLWDKLEEAVGSDSKVADTDADGYTDGTEIRNGFSPVTDGGKPSTVVTSLVTQLSGRILLQVQSRGEAWYLNPADGKRYYLPDGEGAYQIMRYLSLGVTTKDLFQILSSNALLTYTNSDFGYSVSYPSDWQFDENSGNEYYYLYPKSGTGVIEGRGISFVFSKPTDLQTYLKNADVYAKTGVTTLQAYLDAYSDQNVCENTAYCVSYKKITFRSLPAYLVEVGGMGWGYDIIFEKNGMVYQVSLPRYSEGDPTFKDLTITEQSILSSYKLL